MTLRKSASVILAVAVASAFAMPSLANMTHHTHAPVKCSMANACKGKSACKTANNSCKGKNNCKGKGQAVVKMMKEKICLKEGGKVVQ